MESAFPERVADVPLPEIASVTPEFGVTLQNTGPLTVSGAIMETENSPPSCPRVIVLLSGEVMVMPEVKGAGSGIEGVDDECTVIVAVVEAVLPVSESVTVTVNE